MRILLFLLFTTAVSFGWGQILTFEFSALVGSEASAASNSNDPNISASSITRGSGLTAAANGGRFNATNWAITSIANAVSGNDYMEFTITPAATCDFSISSITIQIQRSATGPSQVALRSSADAFAADLGGIQLIVDNTSTQTFTFTFSQTNIAVATTYRIYMFAEATGGTGGPGDGAGNDIIVNGSTSCGPPTNTITTGSITGSPFTVDCSTDDTGSIAFTSSGTFNGGNIYTAELSNAAGSFAAPLSIGTLSSTANNGTINITIPAATITGAGYLIRIVSSNPIATGTSSGAFSVTLSGAPCSLTPPYMTGIIYDGCNVACNGAATEGRSEIIFGNTSNYSVEVNATNVQFIYTTNANQALTTSIVNNAAMTNLLNTEAGCAGLFLNGFGQTLPPNSKFLVVSQNLCQSSLIWSDLCGNAPIYVLYAGASSGTTWDDGGNFGNSGGTRNLQTIITATDASIHNISYSYTSVNGGDGSYATWTSAGGAASTSGIFANCRLNPIVLPSGLTFFNIILEQANNNLFWQTQSEQNNDYFTLFHSIDGFNFQELEKVKGSGNSNSIINYSYTHNRPPRGINYYTLYSTDYDGTKYYKGIVSVMVEGDGIYYDPYTYQLKFSQKSDFSIYTTEGKLIGVVYNNDWIEFNQKGMILIQNLKTGYIERLFIP